VRRVFLTKKVRGSFGIEISSLSNYFQLIFSFLSLHHTTAIKGKQSKKAIGAHRLLSCQVGAP
jgi:hypothetical protein